MRFTRSPHVRLCRGARGARRARETAADPQSGQVLAEYAMIIAVIAIGCLLAILFLNGGIQGLFDSTTRPLGTAPLQPPTALSFPASVGECEDGGWRDFPQFASEEECAAYLDGQGP